VRDFVLKNDGKVVPANGRVGFLIRHVDGAAYATTNVVDLAGQQCLLTQSPPNDDDRKVDQLLFKSKILAVFSLTIYLWQLILTGRNASFSMNIPESKSGESELYQHT
jgi:hypothetical protein